MRIVSGSIIDLTMNMTMIYVYAYEMCKLFVFFNHRIGSVVPDLHGGL